MVYGMIFGRLQDYFGFHRALCGDLFAEYHGSRSMMLVFRVENVEQNHYDCIFYDDRITNKDRPN